MNAGRRRGSVALRATLASCMAGLLTLACLGPGAGRLRPAPPLRLSDLAYSGDPARRASLQLALEGLEADVRARPDQALDSYQRAIQVDPGNAYVYLALARHHADGADPERALPFLDKAEALLLARGEHTPGAEAHLVGLRGAVLFASGRQSEGARLLRRARDLAPTVWSDGHLAAQELR